MITVKENPAGFSYIEVQNSSAFAKVALQGGHLFQYKEKGKSPLLWLSEKSHFETGKAIRGGIPLCWPWFGAHPEDDTLPQHGFARTALFEFVSSDEPDENTSEIILKLTSSDKTFALWPYQFELLVQITVGRELRIALTSRNCGTEPFSISSALHSYFAVSDISQVSVQGLERRAYWDKLTGETSIQQGLLRVNEEVDRVYQNTGNTLLLVDKERTIQIVSKGSASAVVWNPWKEKTKGMADMEEAGYKRMLCVETANVLDDAQRVEPGAEHRLELVVSE